MPLKIFRIYIACARGLVALAEGRGIRVIVNEPDHTLTILETRLHYGRVTNFDNHVTCCRQVIFSAFSRHLRPLVLQVHCALARQSGYGGRPLLRWPAIGIYVDPTDIIPLSMVFYRTACPFVSIVESCGAK